MSFPFNVKDAREAAYTLAGFTSSPPIQDRAAPVPANTDQVPNQRFYINHLAENNDLPPPPRPQQTNTKDRPVQSAKRHRVDSESDDEEPIVAPGRKRGCNVGKNSPTTQEASAIPKERKVITPRSKVNKLATKVNLTQGLGDGDREGMFPPPIRVEARLRGEVRDFFSREVPISEINVKAKAKATEYDEKDEDNDPECHLFIENDVLMTDVKGKGKSKLTDKEGEERPCNRIRRHQSNDEMSGGQDGGRLAINEAGAGTTNGRNGDQPAISEGVINLEKLMTDKITLLAADWEEKAVREEEFKEAGRRAWTSHPRIRDMCVRGFQDEALAVWKEALVAIRQDLGYPGCDF